MPWYTTANFSERGLNVNEAKLTRTFIIQGWVLSGNFNQMLLPQVLDWPALYEMFPQLKTVRVKAGTFKGKDYRAVAVLGPPGNPFKHPIGWSIYLNPLKAFNGTPARLARCVIHEVMHFVRALENKEFGSLPEDPEYHNNPGEIEARKGAKEYNGGPYPNDWDYVNNPDLDY